MPFLCAEKVAIRSPFTLDVLDHDEAAWTLAVTGLTLGKARVTPQVQGGGMASRPTGTAHIGLSLIPLLLAAALVAGCGGTSGVHTQTPTSDPPSSSRSTSPSTAPITTTTTTPSTAAPSIPTRTLTPPRVTPAAQDAVNSYYADYNARTKALRDPAKADLSWIDKYETGKFRTQDEQSYASLKAQHLAYRGATPNPNVKVQGVLSRTAAILTSCEVVHASDLWERYDTTTGKAVVHGKSRTPPPPYLLTFFMKASSGSTWQITSVVQDTSKTCKG